MTTTEPCWKIEKVPKDSGFNEELATLILGSRKPILFVEGSRTSLDIAIYRGCYPDWTVIPKGSCEDVIHSVVTMRGNASLTRVTCSGIIDADGFRQDEAAHLAKLGIATLPVSEVENIILIPSVSATIAKSEGYSDEQVESILKGLSDEIFNTLNSDAAIENVVIRVCRRKVDHLLKGADLSGSDTIAELTEAFDQEMSTISIEDIAKETRETINLAIENRNLMELLTVYDNKGMIALAAQHLKKSRRMDFENWLVRVLGNDNVSNLVTSIKGQLPEVTPQ